MIKYENFSVGYCQAFGRYEAEATVYGEKVMGYGETEDEAIYDLGKHVSEIKQEIDILLEEIHEAI